MPDDPLLRLLLGAVVAAVLGWLLNQLPSLPQVPGRTFSVLRLAFELVILGVSLSWLANPPESSSEKTKALVEALGILCLVFFTIDASQLVNILRRNAGPSSEPDRGGTAGISPKQEYRILKILQEEVKKEVKGRLSGSLHNKVHLALCMKAQPKQVDSPLARGIKIGMQPHYPATPRTNVIEVFEHPEVAGKLLILGAPGAGKTTMLLDLAKQLLARNEEDFEQPIPVLLDLSSWQKDEQSIFDWVVAQLNLRHRVRADVGQRWLREQKLLPLLDGLDELASERQAKCVEAINAWLQSDERPGRVVVCSRLKEYESHEASLNLNGAICLLPLEQSQIKEYLLRVTGPELWQSIASDPALLDLAQTPLFLSIITLAHQEISLPEWHQLASSQERQRYLFDAYIRRMLERTIKSQEYTEHKKPTSEKTRYWLIWLAQRLKAGNQTEFLIEKMQPTWLQERSQKRAYQIGCVLIGGLVGVPIGVLIGVLRSGLMFGLKSGLTSGLTFGLMFGLMFVPGVGLGPRQMDEISVVETLSWSWKKAWSGLCRIPIPELRIGLLSGLLSGLLGSLLVDPKFGAMLVLMLALLFRLRLGLRGGLSGLEVERKATPNQGIRRSACNAVCGALIVGLMFSLIIGMVGGLISGLVVEPIVALRFMLTTGLVIGLIIGLLQYGGITCIQHFTLRLVLWQSGNIPWNYARFLNYATERLLLQRVGGSYRFTHDLLREHFAQMPERS
ncbi:NACHT domain-containing NTPase [Leptolyngbya sp. FACHB-261]|uniref:NACHT domain-containing protein n=1 Tax=Leptolyngbya sp. FACHB-261 TaxID=2692806 RepID=UPI001685C9BC|nr:NACHT domain-containing protein [Leptolyngbya sp. FACHB-261]MBD2100690.1 NACHT domain-containing protein [Leptolyngbya sp. FACHB-261]